MPLRRSSSSRSWSRRTFPRRTTQASRCISETRPPVQTMKDCSVVTATYELGDGMKGTIGIIGPKRMDYEHVLKSLKHLQGELDAIFP